MYPMVARYSSNQLKEISKQIRDISRSVNSHKVNSSTKKINIARPSLKMLPVKNLKMHTKKPKQASIPKSVIESMNLSKSHVAGSNKMFKRNYERSLKCFNQYKKVVDKNSLDSFYNFTRTCKRTKYSKEAIEHIRLSVKANNSKKALQWFENEFTTKLPKNKSKIVSKSSAEKRVSKVTKKSTKPIKKVENKKRTTLNVNKSNTLPNLKMIGRRGLYGHKLPDLKSTPQPVYMTLANAQLEKRNRYTPESFNRKKLQECNRKYKTTIRNNSLKSFDDFAKECPDSFQINEVLNHIYGSVRQKGTATLYSWYISRYPGTKQASQAQKEINKINAKLAKKRKAKEDARKRKIAQKKAYEKSIADEKIAIKQEEQKKVEARLNVSNEYKKVQQINTLERYKEFIDKYSYDESVEDVVRKAKEEYKTLMLGDL